MNVPLDGVQDLPAAQKDALLHSIEQMQIRDSLRLYNSLVERCFSDCIDGFRSKSLDAAEEKCVTKCAEKFMKHSSRTGLRFQELSSELEKKIAK